MRLRHDAGIVATHRIMRLRHDAGIVALVRRGPVSQRVSPTSIISRRKRRKPSYHNVIFAFIIAQRNAPLANLLHHFWGKMPTPPCSYCRNLVLAVNVELLQSWKWMQCGNYISVNNAEMAAEIMRKWLRTCAKHPLLHICH